MECILVRLLSSPPIRIVASFGLSRHSSAFARYAKPLLLPYGGCWTARCPLHTIGVYLIGRPDAGQGDQIVSKELLTELEIKTDTPSD